MSNEEGVESQQIVFVKECPEIIYRVRLFQHCFRQRAKQRVCKLLMSVKNVKNTKCQCQEKSGDHQSDTNLAETEEKGRSAVLYIAVFGTIFSI